MFKPIVFLLVLLSCSLTSWGQGAIDIDVSLSPAGSFSAESTAVSGFALVKEKSGKQYVLAKDVTVDINSLKTGVSLRDKHLKQRLLVEKFPKAKLLKAKGVDGKGVALLEIKGKKLKVNGTYKVEDNIVKASFPINLPDLEIEDVRYMGVGVKDQVTVNIDVPVKSGAKVRVPASNKE